MKYCKYRYWYIIRGFSYVDYNEDNKEHQLDIRLKLKLFDDDLIYKDVQNKKLGYEIKEGSNSKMLSFKRERNVKKKRTI